MKKMKKEYNKKGEKVMIARVANSKRKHTIKKKKITSIIHVLFIAVLVLEAEYKILFTCT